jgi:alkanesulfonate monooxygenase SsuD/methylene tetrahydromethanopterin reductase-like flavin-dependent oxidoreductase (luciferase family)
MRFGVFCTYENPRDNYRLCYAAQTELVRRAEALDFDEAWVAEHHFDPDAASPSILALLAYLAGVTTRIRLGSAAVLLAFRNPIQVAEDVATIDLLSEGRFDFGVAKGGPFALQNKHFLAEQDHTRDMTLEALELVNRLLYEERVTFSGDYYKANDVTLAPKPLQKPIPTYVASTTPAAIEYAARRGFGVMGASPFPLQRIVQLVDAYRSAAPGVDPRLALARFYYGAPTRAEALSEAVPFIRRFSERMRGIFLARGESGANFDPDDIIERSLIGGFDELRDKIASLHEQTRFRSLLLKPTSLDADKNLRALDDFANHVRPFLAPAAQLEQAS